MTPRRRTSGSGSSTTRPDTTKPDATTRPLGGGRGNGVEVDPNNLDTMTTRLNATGGKVDAVGRTVANVNVGPQSMGIVGGNFTGAAQSHLKTAQQHVKTAKDAVDNARAGTTATATRYREREQTTKVNLAKAYNDTTTPATVRPNATTTPAASTTKPPAKAQTPPSTTRPDATTVPLNNNPPGGSISNRLNPPPSNPGSGPWQQSTREQNLQNAQITGLTGIGGGGNVNEAFKATLDDGSHAVYKPASGEDTNGIRQDITSDLGRREVAASRVDEMLGFGRVPTTAWTDGVPPHGPGSLQQFAEGAGPSLDSNQYSRQHQQQMAVIDYINGNTDRHTANYMTAPDGSPVAIDNGFSFPDGERDYIRSDFVRDHLNQPLDPDIVDAVRNVDPNEMRRMLEQSGLGSNAIDLTMQRLDDIQRNGMITGEGWRGEILDANWGPVRGPLP
jgi:hypothetical protein